MKSVRQYREKLRTLKKLGLSNKKNLLNSVEGKIKKTKLYSHPIRLDVVPTKRCNLNCTFCIQYSTGHANRRAESSLCTDRCGSLDAICVPAKAQ